MKIISTTYQCEECGKTYVAEGEDWPRFQRFLGSASIIMDFGSGKGGNLCVVLCSACVKRLEKVWPNLIARFREHEAK